MISYVLYGKIVKKREREKREEIREMTKIITMANQKGGSGKTNVGYHLAGVLSKKHRVLMIDLDAQANMTNNFGMDSISDPVSVCDIFLPSSKNVYMHDLIYKTSNSNIDIIKGDIMMRDTSGVLSLLSKDNVFALIKYLAKHADTIAKYDYVFMDTNPSFSLVNQNALLAADSVILVSDVSSNSYQGAQMLTAQLRNLKTELDIKKDNVKAFVINHYDKRTNLSRDFVKFVQKDEEFADILCKTKINYSVKYKESELVGDPAKLSSIHASSYKDLAKELTKKGIL